MCEHPDTSWYLYREEEEGLAEGKQGSWTVALALVSTNALYGFPIHPEPGVARLILNQGEQRNASNDVKSTGFTNSKILLLHFCTRGDMSVQILKQSMA